MKLNFHQHSPSWGLGIWAWFLNKNYIAFRDNIVKQNSVKKIVTKYKTSFKSRVNGRLARGDAFIKMFCKPLHYLMSLKTGSC